ncbi:DUF6879 family protein [Kribbella sp. NPDC056345]|uniref:DUF6879 family protein n=1 Tax=Kribbella sp. NPDC056345 TaxID=3345789 RepID=UPI0035D89315
MSRWIGPADTAEWLSLFEDFSQSAFRLEGLQTYDATGEEEEAVARFLADGTYDLDLSWWTSMVKGHTDSGHKMTRVRVIVEPLTDYTRFELAGYPQMDAAGDEIRIIEAPEGTWPEGVPQHDFWLFDDRDVWQMHYDDAYAFVGAELVSDPDDIAEHLRWRDAAIAQSVPLADYLAKAAHDLHPGGVVKDA